MAINIAIEQTPAAPLKRPGSTQPSSKRRKQNNDGASSVHLSRSHPLGLKPLGNAFISTTDARPGGLGLFNSLSDELLLDILGLIDSPRDLTCLSQVSKAFYVFARTESLWRDLFLERAKRRLETWAGSWRETYAVQLCGAHDVTQERVRPTRVSDLFSDVLFQPFHCALAPLSSYLPPTSGASVPIPRITSSSYTTAKFFEEFARPNLPVIIEGETNDWPCRTWTLDDLRRRWPDRVFQAEAIRTKLGPYTAYARSCGAHTALGRGVAVPLLPSPSLLGPTTSTSAASTTEVPPNPFNPSSVPDECPYYLFDADFASDPIASGEWRVPELLRTGPGGTQVEADLFSLLGDKRPDWRWLIAGPERSGSGWHKDPNMTSAWNSVVVGSKAWLMLPPHITPPGVYVSADEAEVTAPLSIAEWLLSFYKITKAKHGPRNKGGDGTLREGVCNAGETIYVPSGWWHLVVNLEESVALTQNFVSPAELPAVLHFMRHKPDQISGFKHRRGRNAPASAGPSSCAAPGRPRVAPPSDCHSQLDAGEEAGEEEGEECDEDEDDLKASSALYDLFCSRLQSHDPVLLDNALKVMRERESKENVHAGAQQSASAIRVETEKPAVGTGLSWWERLKQGGPRAGSTTDENHQGANDTLESSPKRETRAQTQTGTGTGTQTQTEAEAAKTQGGFALGLELPPEEELEDVPW